MYVNSVRIVATRDLERAGGFIFEMSLPLARPYEGVVDSFAGALCIDGQTQDFALFVYKLFRMNLATEFEILDFNRFRIVPNEGQSAMSGVRKALQEPFGDILDMTFEDLTGSN